MRRTFYRCATIALLAGFVASCSKEKDEPISIPRTVSANSSTTFSYRQYTNLPEPMTDVKSFKTTPFALGTSQVTGGHPIYVFDGTSWHQFSGPNATSGGLPGNGIGGVIKFATSQTTFGYSNKPDAIYAVTNQNKLYAFVDDVNGGAWTDTGQLASDVTVGSLNNDGNNAGSNLAPVYYLGVDNVSGGHRIYELTKYRNSANRFVYSSREVVPGSAAISIAYSENLGLWCVNSLHEIFVDTSPGATTGGAFIKVVGAATTIASDAETVAITGDRFLNHGYEIFVRNPSATPSDYGWVLQNGDATQIGNGSTGSFGITNDLGEVFIATR